MRFLDKPLIQEVASRVHCWSGLVHCRCSVNISEVHTSPFHPDICQLQHLGLELTPWVMGIETNV